MTTVRSALSIGLVCALSACGNKGDAPATSGAPAASASAKVSFKGVVVGIPVPAEKVAKVVDPDGVGPYAGEKGTLKGTVRMEGDPSPDSGLKVPAKCGEAVVTYG